MLPKLPPSVVLFSVIPFLPDVALIALHTMRLGLLFAHDTQPKLLGFIALSLLIITLILLGLFGPVAIPGSFPVNRRAVLLLAVYAIPVA